MLRNDMCTPIKSGIQTIKDLTPKSPPEQFGLGSPRSLPPASSGSPAGTSFLNIVDNAVNCQTATQKVGELCYALNNCPQKDLPTIYERIVTKIFSLSGGRGFGIGSILLSNQPRDFGDLSDFLSATGPLLKVSYRLLEIPYCRFDFSISFLSSATQQQIKAGTASAFITSKLNAQNPSFLNLNSFELYMFTFAAYIVQPYTQDNKFIPGDSLYPAVLEDYLSFFLPCDGSTPPPLPFPINMSAPVHVVEASPPAPSPSRRSLLRQGLLAAPVRSAPVQNIVSMSGHEVWRSETMINIFSELWLSPFSLPAKSKSESPSLNQNTNDAQLATADTLRIVRMLIKHLHYFSNSGGPMDVTPLDQLKRSVIQNIKKKVYLLFKFIFTNWPHDNSFRLVQETWLSYIQVTIGFIKNLQF